LNRRTALLALLAAAPSLLRAAENPAAPEAPRVRAGPYEVTLMLPPAGLFAGEEIELEFRVLDFRAAGAAAAGPVPVLFARFQCEVDMPSMPGMAKFQEIAHREDVAGVYGVHPTLPHGGDYRFCITLLPPEEQLAMNPRPDGPFTVEFPLDVNDPPPRRRGRPAVKPWELEVSSEPRTPAAGETAELELRVRVANSPDRREVRDFDLVHERPMHLFLVRNDLAYFAHEHPELAAPGVFRLPFRFPAPGDYRLFADVAPVDAGSQVLRADLTVGPGDSGADPTPPSPPLSAPVLSGEAQGVRVALTLPEGGLSAGRTGTVTAALSDGKGKPVADLEPWLGALAHLLLIHQDAETFAHAHPDEREPGVGRNGRIPFLVRLPKPGLYRGWLQFQRGGKVQTVQLALEAVGP
jgi:hypothetical protein